ncbi:ATP-binding protein [Jeotgalibacillus aurantiacus]|uniref:ATP-binding protein n=1 Tax=Jeotgalibacillus aurantiacus TaxID=2763266 RepID=UPI001D0A1D55|nr:ATP-binding protein [Jeotgalibacillus aurantiacus]
MEFILLIAISLIPAIVAASLPFYSKTEVTKALSLFLMFLCLWQIDIAFLYADEFFSEAFIGTVFRIFRIGPIMIMPLMYYFGYYLVKNNQEVKGYRWFFNRYGFYLFLSFSIVVYLVNFTGFGVSGYTVVPETDIAPQHLIPVYGTLNSTFLINVLMVFINTFFLLNVTVKLNDYYFKVFYTKLAFGAVFVFLNGIFSGFGVLPLYFSSFNSILVAILLFLGFFEMQSNKLNDANTRLYKQSSLLETIMNINPNYLVVLNKDNQMIRLNDSICKLLSIKKEAMLCQDFSLLQKEYGLTTKDETLHRIMRPTGEVHFIQWGFRDLELNDEENYTLFYGVDFTNQKQNEELLLSTEKTKVVGELAASIAHEIRNPLTTVRGFIQLLSERNMNGEHEQIILDEIDRIDEVLKELLLLAKPEAVVSQNYPEDSRIDVMQEIGNVKLLFEPVALEQNKRISITNKLPNSIYTKMQKSHFKQVMINTIKNSLEALSTNGSIKIKIDEFEECVRIRIIDNGKGISRKRMSRIGEPYFTNKEKGTGIGLAICFKLIKDYAGKMTVKSKQGWGTTVTVLLPKSEDQSADKEQKQGGGAPVPALENRYKRR